MRIQAAMASGWVFLLLSTALPARAQAPQSLPAAQNSPAATCTDLSRRIVVPCPNDDGTLPPDKEQPKAVKPSAPEAATNSSVSTPARGGGSLPAQNQSPKAAAQTPPTPPLPTSTPADPAPRQSWFRTTPPQLVYSPPSLRNLPRNLAIDQRNFWTSPARIRATDFLLLAPLAGATAAFVVNDAALEKNLPTSPTLIKRSKDFGTYGAAAFAGAVGGAYVLGKIKQNDHLAETGLLSGEAAANTFALTFLVKTATGRQRPLEGNGQGDFRAGGASFPSEHSAAAWSIATVIAHEYPGPLTQLLAYGAAGAMTASRVLGRQHFSSDALIGSALGWFVGRQVYNAHANVDTDDARYGTFVPAPTQAEGRTTASLGSPYVPLDSWVYPAFDRLAALGYVQTAFVGMRPWTRTECARLVEEAQEHADDSDAFEGYLDALAQEFAPELDGARRQAAVESVYTRVTGISGQPLTDGYHFGQTIINDYGRPYQEGFNNVTGASGYATAGPIVFYVRGEYQDAPGAPPLSPSALAALPFSGFVQRPPAPAIPFASTDRFRMLDSYVGLSFRGWEATFGKQSLWWGPGQAGPMLFSNNAEPIYMFRLSREMAYKLPSIFGLLGPMRVELFVGRLAGHHFADLDGAIVGNYFTSLPRQPYVGGQKFTFKPTENLEFGFSRTALFGGPGFPITAHTLRSVFFSSGNITQGVQNGDQRSAFEFSYRVPGLRKWLTIYNDSFTEDEFSPIAYPRRSAMNPGIYIPQFPKLPKLDFRAEGVYTDLPGLRDTGFYYWHDQYVDGYTNKGNILGSWVGREGRGIMAWSTYHISPESFIQVGFRKQGVNPVFVGGGVLRDIFAQAQFASASGLTISAFVQHERWDFPVVSPTAKTNLSTTVQLTYRPNWKLR